jgi:hypothetical protein
MAHIEGVAKEHNALAASGLRVHFFVRHRANLAAIEGIEEEIAELIWELGSDCVSEMLLELTAGLARELRPRNVNKTADLCGGDGIEKKGRGVAENDAGVFGFGHGARGFKDEANEVGGRLKRFGDREFVAEIRVHAIAEDSEGSPSGELLACPFKGDTADRLPFGPRQVGLLMEKPGGRALKKSDIGERVDGVAEALDKAAIVEGATREERGGVGDVSASVGFEDAVAMHRG